MKTSALPLYFASFFFAMSSINAQETFVYNGIERTYFLDMPDLLAPGAPLVFVLHGYTSSAGVIRYYSGWSALAESEGFAVCYPQGTLDDFGISHWNANLGISETDDHGFLVALAEHLQAQHELGTSCTYACGMSNGGYMSYSLACEHPETFRAVGSVTGAMSGYDFVHCNPSEPVPIVHLHGTADLTVGYNTGVGNANWGMAGVPEIIEFWTELMGTTATDEVTLPNQEFPDITSVELIRHHGAPNGQEFHHYRVVGGGHDWFGAWGSQDVQSTEVIWSFFDTHCSGGFSNIEVKETSTPPALFEIHPSQVQMQQSCQLEGLDWQGRLIWILPEVSAGTTLSFREMSGANFIRAINDSGTTQVHRLPFAP